MSIFKVPKTSYNFVRQTVHLIDDNSSMLNRMRSGVDFCGKRNSSPLLNYVDLVKSKEKGLAGLKRSLLQFLLFMNINREKARQRVSSWELIYEKEV